MNRPARKNIPKSVDRIILRRQKYKCAKCGEPLSPFPLRRDHRPPLSEREVNEDRTDYIPPQLDPAYIEIIHANCHDIRTFGSGGTTRIETRSGDMGRLHHNRRAKAKHESHEAIMRAKYGSKS